MSKKDLLKEIRGNQNVLNHDLQRLWTAVDRQRIQLDHNAKLSKLLVEYLGLTFYEIPAQESKIEIRKKEKVSDNTSKRKGR